MSQSVVSFSEWSRERLDFGDLSVYMGSTIVAAFDDSDAYKSWIL
jgi:hypothetical protein